MDGGQTQKEAGRAVVEDTREYSIDMTKIECLSQRSDLVHLRHLCARLGAEPRVTKTFGFGP